MFNLLLGVYIGGFITEFLDGPATTAKQRALDAAGWPLAIIKHLSGRV